LPNQCLSVVEPLIPQGGPRPTPNPKKIIFNRHIYKNYSMMLYYIFYVALEITILQCVPAVRLWFLLLHISYLKSQDRFLLCHYLKSQDPQDRFLLCHFYNFLRFFYKKNKLKRPSRFENRCILLNFLLKFFSPR
jgi:hypothetical protein